MLNDKMRQLPVVGRTATKPVTHPPFHHRIIDDERHLRDRFDREMISFSFKLSCLPLFSHLEQDRKFLDLNRTLHCSGAVDIG